MTNVIRPTATGAVDQRYAPDRTFCIYSGVAKTSQIQPQALLNEEAKALDGTMALALSTAEHSAVHKLRTGSRRLEALLALLDLLPGLPEHAGETAEVQRLLRRVRRAAAAVRDLDVQAHMIAADMPDRAAVSPGSRGYQDRQQARKLLKKLERRRVREAADLQSTLLAEREDVVAAMAALEHAVSPEAAMDDLQKRHAAKGYRVSEVISGIQQWFIQRSARLLHTHRRGSREQALQRLQRLNDDVLHDLRKAAKQCRYLAESLPGSAGAKLAERFEYLQEAGGRWHDWLMLEELAARVHGKKSALAERYRTHRNAALAEYHLQLALEFTTGLHDVQGITASHDENGE